MSNPKKVPSDAEIQGFLGRLKEYRATLAEGDQSLLDAMVNAALGKHAEPEDEVQSYWVAYHNPVGPAGGVGYGTAVAGPYGAAGFNTTPWGTAYGVRY